MKLIRVGVDGVVRGDWIKALLAQIEPGCEIGMEA
jgi:hypothetical protein